MRYDWTAESKLAADIVPPAEVASGNTVLLTGATGFCGIFLLAELLASTSRNVVCIVRAPLNEVALQRLEEKLCECDLSTVLPRMTRVKVVRRVLLPFQVIF